MLRAALLRASTILGLAVFCSLNTASGPVAHRPLRATNGEFVSTPDGKVYRLAGGAPLYVSDWSVFGGPEPTTAVSADQLTSLPLTPIDGTLLCGRRAGGLGGLFVVAGGAPVWVSNVAVLGRAPSVCTQVDQFTIDHAGGGSFLNHLNATPVDGTLLCGQMVGGSSGEFVIVGGAPVGVLSVADLGEALAVCTKVDQFSIDHAGGGGYLNHLNATPAFPLFLSLHPIL